MIDTSSAPVLGTQVDIATYVKDRFDDGHPPMLVDETVKALRAQLVVRTAMEMFAPDDYQADALLWAVDLRRVADGYGVPLPVAARYIHIRATDMALSWRRSA